jgi:CelD/BcsL family acetyltransferase involved in cellulose biosynthesis
MSIHARWISSIDELRAFGPRYDTMVLAAGEAGLFYQLGWLERVWPYYQARHGGTLSFLVAEQRGELVALAPLMIVTKGWAHARQRVLTFIGGTQDELDNWMPGFLFATREHGEQAQVMTVFADAIADVPWDLLDLPLVRAACPGRPALLARFPRMGTAPERLTTPRARLDGGWNAYQDGRNKRLMRILARGSKRAAEDGLDLVHEVTDNVPAGRRDEVEAIHQARQARIREAGRARSSPFDDPGARRAFWSLIDWSAAQAQLRAYWLRLGSRTIAYVIVLHHAGTSFAFFNAIDPAAEKYHPGSLILAELIRSEATDFGAVVIDMMAGANLTKKLFATEELAHVHLSVVRPDRFSSAAKDAWIRFVRRLLGLRRD